MTSNNQNGTANVPSSSITPANLLESTIVSPMMASATPSVIRDPIDPASLSGRPSSTLTAVVPAAASSSPPPSNPTQTSSMEQPPVAPQAFPPLQSSITSSAPTSGPPSTTSIPVQPSTPVSSSPSIIPTSAALISSALTSPALTSPALISSPAQSSPSQTEPTSSTPSPVTSSMSGIFSSYSSSVPVMATTSPNLPASSTFPAAVTGSATAPTGSSHGSSRNIAVIAAPVAVGAGLVPILVLFFCWWKRRRSFQGTYHHRNRSNDTEMSNLSANAQESSYEPKRSPDGREVTLSTVPDMSSTTPPQAETKTWLGESTFKPGVLPGLAPMSPAGTSFVSPPPYRKSDGRSDSPTMIASDMIEPFDVTRLPKIAGAAQRPVSAHRQSASKRHASVSAEDIEWPLPSPFRDLSSKDSIPIVPSLGAIKGDRPVSPKAQSSRLSSSLKRRPDLREGFAGPSRAKPIPSTPPRQASPNASERDLAAESPFDDKNANDSASEYSVSIRNTSHRTSMLNVAEAKRINDDGISEMSVSSSGSNRQARLNQRASDEISDVSSLDEDDDVARLPETGAGSRSLTALPDIPRA